MSNLARRPFAKPVTLQGSGLPDSLKEIERSVDDEGRNLTQFAYGVLKTAINRGLCHILVDYPKVPAVSVRQERQQKIKPILRIIDPKDLIGWRYEKTANGDKTLTQIRIAETHSVDGGAFGVEVRERIRVIEPTEWKLYEKKTLNGAEGWDMIEQGPWTVGKITLVTIYLNPTGFMTATPPLEDLAYLNLAHWQSLSDHRNNIRFARAGTVYMLGLTPEEVDKTFVWGVNRVIKSTNDNAKVGVCEHSGSSTKAGEEELRHLEDMMQAMGLEPLTVRNWGNETAMGRAIDEGKGQCDLQSWVRIAEGGLRQAFVYAGQWVGVEVEEDFGVDIFDDIGMSLRSTQDLDHLLKAVQAGKLSDETYLREIKMRGVLAETVDIEQELERIKAQGPPLGMLGRLPGQEPEMPMQEPERMRRGRQEDDPDE